MDGYGLSQLQNMQGGGEPAFGQQQQVNYVEALQQQQEAQARYKLPAIMGFTQVHSFDVPKELGLALTPLERLMAIRLPYDSDRDKWPCSDDPEALADRWGTKLLKMEGIVLLICSLPIIWGWLRGLWELMQ